MADGGFAAAADRARKKTQKFDRIDIWRTEVSASQVYCVCSAPATPVGGGAHSVHDGTVPVLSSSSVVSAPASASTTAVDSVKHVSELTDQRVVSPEPTRPKFTLRFLKSSRPDQVQTRPATREEGGAACTVCSSPIDQDVSYVSFKRDGSGLAHLAATPRPTPTLPRSKAGAAKRSTGEGSSNSDTAKKKAPARPNLRKAVSDLFKASSSTKTAKRNIADGNQLLSPPPPPSTTTLTPVLKGKPAFRTHKSSPSLSQIFDPPRTGTQMYRSLRRRTDTGGAEDEHGSIDTLGVVSDDERNKPRLKIDDTAARLQRAQNLLNKRRVA